MDTGRLRRHCLEVGHGQAQCYHRCGKRLRLGSAHARHSGRDRVLLTLGLVFMPWRKVGYGFRLLFDKQGATGEGEVKPFNALMTALSATVGTGNIAGVATAIALGGPGAIFYMWLIALFGMATKYAEAVCAVTYREVDATGKYVGGPMYYLRNGVGEFAPELGKWLGLAFAVFGAVAAFGIGNAVQVNSMGAALENSFGIPEWATGVVVAAPGGRRGDRRHPPYRRSRRQACAGHDRPLSRRRPGDPADQHCAIPDAIGLIFTHAFHAGRGDGRLCRRGGGGGHPLRDRARRVLERVGTGFRGDRPRGRTDQQPGSPGHHRHARYLHRHPRGLHDDRARDPDVGRLDDDGRRRRRADRSGAHLDRLRDIDDRRAVHRHHRARDLRVHDDPRLVLLR